ncbi:WcbI family polysaccharide biosynthesis putative acetyltransferase [Methylobacterium durans]|uniref:WcbI family polysaccharide biosynthesis putative acetyltransferase n=1 Tax=Methylobacterium durans TaxID=2202825 RepID=UPI002AFEBE69|nr:WcbI family polysaccharide biosynthesis putative acetyltransferase [Methylobacterium durans]MEA1830813.1 WcbI family polysaccharide biosynthesis putative acetyltransferase [Methylobacterium durans]
MDLSTLHRRALRAIGLSTPSWANPWQARRADATGRAGAKIAVIGNCQARGAAQAMRLLAPASPVRFIQMAWLKREHGHLDNLARTLSDYDHVFAQHFPDGLIPGGDVYALRAREPRLVMFPTIVFNAFHPDTVYAGNLAHLSALKLAPSPMGHYHSAIALMGHRLGLSAPETLTLFREEVFDRLGYLQAWDSSVRDLLASAAQIGFPLDREIGRWARGGNFMHVINHPKGTVIDDIARRLLTERGLRPEPVSSVDYLGDELARDVVWPVYPEIAETFGFTGSYLFKRKPRGAAFPALYDLATFLSESFALYDAQTPEDLHCVRVEAWLATPEIRAMFEAAKGS